MQEEGLASDGRHHMLLLHKQEHDKRGIAESLHVYINKARLTRVRWVYYVYINKARLTHVRWAYFREKYHYTRKYAHPLFEEPQVHCPWVYFQENTVIRNGCCTEEALEWFSYPCASACRSYQPRASELIVTSLMLCFVYNKASPEWRKMYHSHEWMDQ